MARERVEIDSLRPSGFLRFMYRSAAGRILLKIMVIPALSKAVGAFMSSPLSKPMIKSFIKKNGIDMALFENGPFKSYNEFFTRKILSSSRPVSQKGLISPCDAKLTAYKIDENSVFNIKQSEYSLESMLCNGALAAEFKNGICLIFRLAVDDYHRYCYFDDCTEVSSRYIKGKLHTVQPIAFEKHKVFHQNCREYTLLDTEHFGRAVQIEIGAMCVGKIQNHHTANNRRGDEKGMFLFGGSTVVLLLNNVEIDADIIENTQMGYETKVVMGEKIGRQAQP